MWAWMKAHFGPQLHALRAFALVHAIVYGLLMLAVAVDFAYNDTQGTPTG